MKNLITSAERWAIGLLSAVAMSTFFFPLVTIHVPVAGDQEVTGYDALSKMRQFKEQFTSATATLQNSSETALTAPTRDALPSQSEVELPPPEVGKACPAGKHGEYSDAAVRYLADSAAKDPSNIGWASTAGMLFYCMRHFEQAAKWYEKVLELDPRWAQAHTDLGTCYFALGRAKDALGEYQKSLVLRPDDEQTLAMAIRVSVEGTHDISIARTMWERLHQLDPNHPILQETKKMIDDASHADSESPGVAASQGKMPFSMRALWIVPICIGCALACSLGTLLGSIMKSQIYKSFSITGTILGGAAILQLVIANSDMHTMLQGTLNSGAVELKGNPFAGAAQTIANLALNAFQLKPGGGLYALTISLAFAAFLANSRILSPGSEERA